MPLRNRAPIDDGDSSDKGGSPLELGPAILAHSPTRPGPHVLLAIHFDTVFGPEHPFQSVTRIDDKTLRGPGVCDAKGGLLVLLFALQALEAFRICPAHQLGNRAQPR